MRSPYASPSLTVSSLAPHFAFLGFEGGWIMADAFEVPRGNLVRWLLVFVTPIVAALLGRYLSQRIQRGGALTTGLLSMVATAFAGILNGMIIGLCLAPPTGMLIGVPFGAICMLPFVPLFGLLIWAARRNGRAREGSMVDASDRLATTSVLALTMSLFAALPLRTVYAENAMLSIVFPLAAAVLSAALGLRDARALATLGALSRVPSRPASSLSGDEANVIDLGLGDGMHEEVVQRGSPYRNREEVITVFRGELGEARKALRANFFISIAALLTSLLVIVIRLSIVLPVETTYRLARLSRLLG